ncbi:hypothetical protein NC653_009389 [Populus alba x Populus x berolinensis]|uniref:Uncharacterized protein n=1 Tax=Populus alba x Populus x berolinensis TaxID=444605 RepID=A0AAD6WBJ2_9ROSI|nr:hypothetical protein NC653_009389 [Populus alba x Populus x berolinensis]
MPVVTLELVSFGTLHLHLFAIPRTQNFSYRLVEDLASFIPSLLLPSCQQPIPLGFIFEVQRWVPSAAVLAVMNMKNMLTQGIQYTGTAFA